MFRLLGFLVGSLASMALLVYLIGMPRFDNDADHELIARFDAAVEKLKDKRDDSTPAEYPAVDDAGADEPQAATAPFPNDAVETGPEPQQGNGDEALALPDALPDADAIAAVIAEPEWYEFWTPFSSDIAARGFVNRLESVTGLDYRVTRVTTGRYQVEFAYRDPAELNANLSQIAAATGLDVSGEYP